MHMIRKGRSNEIIRLSFLQLEPGKVGDWGKAAWIGCEVVFGELRPAKW
ncbi:hypothetical protein GCM10008018_30610 [Paenibacillus marchantiophytorum]|uniref:Uncharacterized protein n=1 Tax=Paenibacillus marchantiophytorum TaxID=1619310 RepID=A0ABQ1ERE9_9BACL|nr:hypothetical protein [Paenibacillus marchantiophytorum]GFZ82648.1 hypothetical protein GCM10008018_30610 [Paenibacillus marchantiophytorum]